MEMISDRGESLTSQVHRALRQAITMGELAPGSLHSVAKLAERLQVSRSPVREALISLADQGMVAFERNRGVRILQTTAHDLEEVFSLRLLLEVPATFRAAQIITPADVERLRDALGSRDTFVGAATMLAHQEMDSGFHRVILEATGNRRLVGVVDNLWSHQKMRGVTSAGRTRQLADIHREHEAVFERIEAGDALGAATAMREHLSHSASLLLAQETGDSAESADDMLPWLDVFAALQVPGYS
ncbi:GntR family transcriptional regulator [Amycolatopsis palatopharyngis]|uniref:GntR family transcriptional regulator n=1 Tax=Amycolatopsis palatopharyngis TaxID=187982 RepID=UPI001FEC1497|nr:GntR family transcriptional regulator [Amycolatopsis palatopharyngis]